MRNERTAMVGGVTVRHHLARTVLITGGTDGLGRALADAYREAGWRVFVVGRAARDPDAAGAAARLIQVDLSDPLAHRTIAAALDARGVSSLDLLIHNAAAGAGGPIERCGNAQIESLVAVNVWAPIALTHTLLPRLQSTRGKVVFIGSVAAFAPASRYAIYAATKAALDGFARSLAQELRGAVAVQVVHPGPIRTAFHARAGFDDLDTSSFPTPERVAAQVVRAIEQRGWRRFVDLQSKAIGVASRLLRAPIDRMVARRVAVSAPRTGVQPPVSGAQPHRAIVTGAASGLGEAIAIRLLEQGASVLALDRAAALSATLRSAARVTHVVVDLSDRATLDRLETLDRFETLDGPDAVLRNNTADLLIHCAGTSAVGPFAQQSLDGLRTVLWTNLLAPMIITARALEGDVLTDDASIVFVSSLSHYVGYPGAAVYAASKDGLTHFARSLRIALKPRGLNCLTVFPGPMRTPHAQRFAPPGASAARRMPPEVVAALVMEGVRRRRSRQIPGAGPRLAAALGAMFPTLLTRLMGRTLYRRLAAAPIVVKAPEKVR